MDYKIIIFLLLLFLPAFVSASVVINEIAWMGTEASYNDEWIELKNLGEEKVNLNGWVLKAEDGSPEIELEGEISTFYLLERTDDETIPGVKADLIYTGALSNKGENLKLIDSSGNTIEEVVSGENWPAGDNETKQTMEKSNGFWQTSKKAGGTPKGENSQGIQQSEEALPAEDGSPQSQSAENEPLPAKDYPGGIVFSEILPSPEGPDAEEEWIEIYNNNDFQVNLNLWQIRDKEGRVTTFTFPETIISPKEYLLLKRPQTRITLNNSGDGLELLNPKGEIIDSATYGKATLGESYSKTNNTWNWTGILTPGSENKPLEKEPLQSGGSFSETGRKEPYKEFSSEKAKAQASGTLQNKNAFLIAVIVALASASALLFIRRSFTL